MPSPKFEIFQLNLSDRVYVEAKLLRLGPLLGVPNHKMGAEITNKSREGELISSFSAIRMLK